MSIIEESTLDVTNIVKIAAAFLVGLVILSGLITGTVNAQDHQSAVFTFTENPQAEGTITLNNHVFEFTSDGNVASGHIPVQIGATLTDSVSNLETAIHSNTDFIVS